MWGVASTLVELLTAYPEGSIFPFFTSQEMEKTLAEENEKET